MTLYKDLWVFVQGELPRTTQATLCCAAMSPDDLDHAGDVLYRGEVCLLYVPAHPLSLPRGW